MAKVKKVNIAVTYSRGAPNCGVTYDHHDERKIFIVQATGDYRCAVRAPKTFYSYKTT